MEDYLSIKETANIVGVSTQTLRNWEKKGILMPYRNPVNNYRMYRVPQIEQFIEESRNKRLKNTKFHIKLRIIQD